MGFDSVMVGDGVFLFIIYVGFINLLSLLGSLLLNEVFVCFFIIKFFFFVFKFCDDLFMFFWVWC